MCYKFVKITTFYRDYLSFYYSKNPGIINKTYSEQYKHLMNDCFAWADYFQLNFAKIGVESFEIIANANNLQQAWAAEHNTSEMGTELILTQLETIKPDIVFFQNSQIFSGKWIRHLKERIPKIKKIIGWCCSPFSDETLELYKEFDFMLTCSPLFNEIFKKKGFKSYHINHAFETTILNKIQKTTDDKKDVIFIGSLIPGKEFHDHRISILEKLFEAGLDIDVYSSLIRDTPFLLYKKQGAYILARMLKKFGIKKISDINIFRKIINLNEIPQNPTYSPKLMEVAKSPVYGLEMYKTIKESKVNLNIHGGVGGDYAANMRLFEVTGMGSCLITDMKKNLSELFDIDREIVAFKNADECIEKIKWLINNPQETKKIAAAGQSRTLKDHTFEIRVKQLDDIIKKELNSIN